MPDPAPAPGAAAPGPPPRVVLLVNPAAGGGRAGRAADVAQARLRARGLDVERTAGSDGPSATALAREAVAAGVDALVVCGGDGLATLALQAVAGTSVPLGLVPAGTGNDLAGALGVPVGDPADAADVVADAQVRAVDAVRSVRPGREEPLWWANVASAGFDAAVTERANRLRWPRGRRRYDLAVLAELRVLRPLPFVVTVDDERHEVEATLVAVGNGPSYGAGMRITPGARLDDGLLDVTVLPPLSRRRLVRLFPLLFSGRHAERDDVLCLRGARVRVECAQTVAYADGERVGALPLDCEVVPGALRVLVPAGVPAP